MSGKPVAAEGGLTAVSPQDFSLMNVPIFYASSLNVYVPGNDAALLFMRPHPGLIPGLEDNTAVIVAEPVASVQMSVQTLKDLYLAIKLQLDIYEKDFGEITTAFSRKIEKQKEDDAAKAAPSRRRAKG